jgi:hypothetical protein
MAQRDADDRESPDAVPVDDLVSHEPDELETDELRDLARRRGLESVDDLGRDELIERIRATDIAGA